MKAPVPAFADTEAQAILTEICAARNIPVQLLHELAECVAGHSGSGRAHGVMADVEDIISPYVDAETGGE